MFTALNTELHKIACIDKIDEISSHKWTQKAQKQLEKLNNDSNCTAGLEAELTLAVESSVMLRQNRYKARSCQWCHWNSAFCIQSLTDQEI